MLPPHWWKGEFMPTSCGVGRLVYLSTPAENGIIIRLPNGDDKLAEQVQALVLDVLGNTVAFEVTHHNGQKKSIRVKVDYKQWDSLTKGLKSLGYAQKHWNSPV